MKKIILAVLFTFLGLTIAGGSVILSGCNNSAGGGASQATPIEKPDESGNIGDPDNGNVGDIDPENPDNGTVITPPNDDNNDKKDDDNNDENNEDNQNPSNPSDETNNGDGDQEIETNEPKTWFNMTFINVCWTSDTAYTEAAESNSTDEAGNAGYCSAILRNGTSNDAMNANNSSIYNATGRTATFTKGNSQGASNFKRFWYWFQDTFASYPRHFKMTQYVNSGYGGFGWATSIDNTLNTTSKGSGNEAFYNGTLYTSESSCSNQLHIGYGPVYAIYRKAYTHTYYRNYTSSDTTTYTKTRYAGLEGIYRSGLSRTGYTFKGWNTNRSATNAFFTGNQIMYAQSFNNDQSFYAVWQKNTYSLTITYNSDSVYTDSTSISISASDYTVGSSSISRGGSTTVSHLYESNSFPITLKTVTPGNYYIGVSSTGTSPSSSITLSTSSNVNSISFNWIPTSNQKIYVKVAQRYTLTYYYLNSSGSKLNTSQYKIYGTDVTLYADGTASANYTSYGWSYYGWASSISSTTRAYSSGAAYSTNANISLYHLGSRTLTLNYNANGGSGSMSSTSGTQIGNLYGGYYDRTSLTAAACGFTRTGYSFAGWNTNSSGTGTNVAAGAAASLWTSYATSASKTLYAKWTPNAYNVRLDANGGSVSPTSKVVNYGNTYSDLPTPTREGYSFDGWGRKKNYLDPDAMMSYFNSYSTSSPVTKEADGSYTWAGSTAYLGNSGSGDTYRLYNPGGFVVGGTYRVSYKSKNPRSDLNPTTCLIPWHNGGINNIDMSDDAYVRTSDWSQITYTFVVPSDFGGFSFPWYYGDRTPFRDIRVERIDTDDYETTVTASTTMNIPSDHTLYAKWSVLPVEIQVQAVDALGNKVSGVGFKAAYNGTTYNYNISSTQAISLGKITYGTTITFSNITSNRGFVVKSMTADVGLVSGAYNYTVGSSAAKLTIHLSLLQYDSTEQYYYIEEGEFPQGYVGDSLNVTLSSSATATGKTIAYSNNKTNSSIPIYTYNGQKYARVEKNSVAKWFVVEPIRWRLTEYGTTAYPIAVEQKLLTGNVDVVSDRVLYFGSVEADRVYEDENNNSTTYDLYNNVLALNENLALTTLSQSKTVGFDKYKDDPNQNAVESVSKTNYRGVRAVSENELSASGLTDRSAYATDFAAFVLGKDSSRKVDYWTRNLSNALGNGKVIGTDGQATDKFLNRLYGVRLSLTISFA